MKLNNMNEEWKDIEDFKDKYEISNFGRIRNKLTNHIYKMTNQYGWYFAIILYDNTHKRTARIHREVAKAFIPNPNNLPEVNHKDLNKQNNRVDNLEWCTRKYNTIHGIKNGAKTLDGLNKYNKNKSYEKYGYIYQFSKSGEFIDKHFSALSASIKTGICHRNILQCINHEPKRKTAGGYIWLKESEVVNNAL